MNDIIRIIFINLILFPIVVYRNLCFSIVLMYGEAHPKIMRKEILKQRSLGLKHTREKANGIGGLFEITTTIPTLFMLILLSVCSLVKIIKTIFNWQFIWLSTDLLVLIGFISMGYSVLMIIIFGIVSWICKAK